MRTAVILRSITTRSVSLCCVSCEPWLCHVFFFWHSPFQYGQSSIFSSCWPAALCEFLPLYMYLIWELTLPNRNVVYILLFLMLELCLIFDAASSFALADGLAETSANLITAAGAFGFVSSLCGYYCVLHYLCEDSLPFSVPMGDTSRAWKRWCKKTPHQNVKSEEDMA